MEDIHSFESELITLANNLEVLVNRWGRNNKTTIILLHGMGSTGKSFKELAYKLSTHFQILAVDLPGHGESTFKDNIGFFSMESLAVWLKDIIDYYRIEDFHIAGHSLGGYISLAYAKNNNVNSVILLDGGYIQSSSLPGIKVEDEIKMAQQHIDQYTFQSWKKYEEEQRKSGLSNKTIELAKHNMKIEDNKIKLAIRPEAAKYITKHLFCEPAASTLSSIASPVLLLRSTLPVSMNDIRNTSAERLKTYLKIVVINVEESSHEIYWDQPESISEKIKEWISKDKSGL
ncbi:MAG: alpha/beta fold hydrolase [Bacillota bacterium]